MLWASAPTDLQATSHDVRDGRATLAVVEGSALKYWNILKPGGETVGRQLAGGSTRLYVKDHLGSIRAVVDPSEEGSVVEERDYYPFGLPLPGRYERGSPATKEDFTGHVKDTETGLHYAGARYYSAAFGRWTSTDPILGEKGPKKLLKQDARLLTMTSYNYAFGNPATLTDPTGMAPIDWFKTKSGKIKYDEDVQSQADLKEGQTYLGENVLDKRGDGPIQLLTEGGDRVNVFDGGMTEGEVVAKGASSTSISETAVSSLLSAESVSGGKALSGLKTGAKAFGRGLSGVAALFSSGSEVTTFIPSFGESDRFGTYEKVKLGVDAASFAASFTGIGTVVNVATEVTPAGNGMFLKERGTRLLTRQILEERVDHVVPQ